MATIRIYTLGKVRQKFILEGEQEYLQRLKKSFQVEITEIPTKANESALPESVKAEEGKLLLSRLSPGEFFIALTERGLLFDSPKFAQWFEQSLEKGGAKISFGIGGAFGWAPEVLNRANAQLSLSPLTFPYQLTRLILMEQLYRAMTLCKNIPYHK